jgi:hypothetical protein
VSFYLPIVTSHRTYINENVFDIPIKVKELFLGNQSFRLRILPMSAALFNEVHISGEISAKYPQFSAVYDSLQSGGIKL